MANATTEIYIKAAGGSDRFMVAVSILVGVAVGDVVDYIYYGTRFGICT